jgi:hypothetical protein
MSSGDENTIIRTFLLSQASLTALVSQRIFCPRLPENTALPAIGFFARGGNTNPFTKSIKSPSVQFDCWGTTPIEARSLYLALFDVLQGVGGFYAHYVPVVVGANTYYILGAKEESIGQDIQDVSTPNYYKVLSFFNIKIQIE